MNSVLLLLLLVITTMIAFATTAEQITHTVVSNGIKYTYVCEAEVLLIVLIVSIVFSLLFIDTTR
jgi:hypothetical protein